MALHEDNAPLGAGDHRMDLLMIALPALLEVHLKDGDQKLDDPHSDSARVANFQVNVIHRLDSSFRYLQD